MSYVSIRIDSGAAERLNQFAAERGMTKSQAIVAALDQQAADALLNEMDAKTNIPMEEIDVSDWVAGVAPECCCEFVSEGFRPKYKCEHWKKVRWQDKNGRTRINWYNDLVEKFDFADDWKIAMQEYM